VLFIQAGIFGFLGSMIGSVIGSYSISTLEELRNLKERL